MKLEISEKMQHCERSLELRNQSRTIQSMFHLSLVSFTDILGSEIPVLLQSSFQEAIYILNKENKADY